MAYGEPVHPIMQFDPSDSTYLYLMTSYQVRPSAEQSFGHHVPDVAFAPSREQEGTIAFALTPVGRASEFGALAGVSEGSAGGLCLPGPLHRVGVMPSGPACRAFSPLEAE